jgi:hypothetical protein
MNDGRANVVPSPSAFRALEGRRVTPSGVRMGAPVDGSAHPQDARGRLFEQDCGESRPAASAFSWSHPLAHELRNQNGGCVPDARDHRARLIVLHVIPGEREGRPRPVNADEEGRRPCFR